MRITFICGCLEPGKDGVGDYTRRLARALEDRGHAIQLVALYDHYVLPVSDEPVTTANSFRYRNALSPEGADSARDCITSWGPDVVSLQFVSYSFNPRGHINALTRFLVPLRGKMPIHIMFHEIWIGVHRDAPIHHRIEGQVQRIEQRRMLRLLKPGSIHTNSSLYRFLIGKLTGDEPGILPLFGNVPYIGGADASWLKTAIPCAFRSEEARKRTFLAGIFGVIHPQWSASALLTLFSGLRQRGRLPVLILFGRNKLKPSQLEEIVATLRGVSEVLCLGELPEEKISSLIQHLDLGVGTTAWSKIEKSGTVAAMLDHGLPVYVTREDTKVSGFELNPEPMDAAMLIRGDRLDIDALLGPRQFQSRRTLELVCDRFLYDLNAAFGIS